MHRTVICGRLAATDAQPRGGQAIVGIMSWASLLAGLAGCGDAQRGGVAHGMVAEVTPDLAPATAHAGPADAADIASDMTTSDAPEMASDMAGDMANACERPNFAVTAVCRPSAALAPVDFDDTDSVRAFVGEARADCGGRFSFSEHADGFPLQVAGNGALTIAHRTSGATDLCRRGDGEEGGDWQGCAPLQLGVGYVVWGRPMTKDQHLELARVDYCLDSRRAALPGRYRLHLPLHRTDGDDTLVVEVTLVDTAEADRVALVADSATCTLGCDALGRLAASWVKAGDGMVELVLASDSAAPIPLASVRSSFVGEACAGGTVELARLPASDQLGCP